MIEGPRFSIRDTTMQTNLDRANVAGADLTHTTVVGWTADMGAPPNFSAMLVSESTDCLDYEYLDGGDQRHADGGLIDGGGRCSCANKRVLV
jgi:hypothetical protein